MLSRDAAQSDCEVIGPKPCTERTTPKVTVSREPKVIGSCDICGEDVPVGEPLWRIPGVNRFACEACCLAAEAQEIQ